MITECLNPSCRKELRYLRDGKVVRTVRYHEEQVKVEHFWLCGDCRLDFDFRFSADNQVSLTRRYESVVRGEPSLDLTLVA
jgi:hypothetical protein